MAFWISTTPYASDSVQTDTDHLSWDAPVNNTLLRDQQQLIAKHRMVMEILNRFVIPIICLVGVLGNAVNFYVFYCRWYMKFMNDAEKCVTVGLMSLSISDAMFCLAVLPNLFLFVKSDNGDLGLFLLHYRAYSPFFVNLFLLNSTWLIASVSVQRLVAVTWMRERFCVTDPRKTALIHGGIFILAFCSCIPLLLRYSVVRSSCLSDRTCYYLQPSETITSPAFVIGYQVFWAFFGTFVPLALLAFTNIRLILILCQGQYSERLGSNEGRHRTKITLLVITMILSFLLLVTPSMIVEFLTWTLRPFTPSTSFQPTRPSASNVEDGLKILMAVTVTKLLQAIKFSFNFLLYCSTSRQFRKEFRSCKVNDSCRANRVYQEANPKIEECKN